MKEKPKVSIYYDVNCAFCKRSVELIVKLFFVRTKHVGPAQDDSSIYSTMQKFDSWVVADEKGQTFTTFKAGVEIAKYSPVLKILVPLTKFNSVQRVGEWMYRKIANNRDNIWLP